MQRKLNLDTKKMRFYFLGNLEEEEKKVNDKVPTLQQQAA